MERVWEGRSLARPNPERFIPSRTLHFSFLSLSPSPLGLEVENKAREEEKSLGLRDRVPAVNFAWPWCRRHPSPLHAPLRNCLPDFSGPPNWALLDRINGPLIRLNGDWVEISWPVEIRIFSKKFYYMGLIGPKKWPVSEMKWRREFLARQDLNFQSSRVQA